MYLYLEQQAGKESDFYCFISKMITLHIQGINRVVDQILNEHWVSAGISCLFTPCDSHSLIEQKLHIHSAS